MAGATMLICAASIAIDAILSQTARADEPYGRHQFSESERDHWAFVPVKRPVVPTVRDASWATNPIDAFILARLEKEALRPNPPADPRTLLRRVYLDLIGLPPTIAQQQSFLNDPSPERFARVVDELLARPEYGERWGRHWLDVVRYAESNGYERDGAKPSAWRYRDWVIDAFNSDKPYDRFLIEQLAGDELPEADAQTHIAATFLRLGAWDDEPADPMVDRYDQLDDIVGTTCATFMAQTLRCARCHDHKFESFTQRDYSRMLAIFEPLKRPQDARTDQDRIVGTEAELAAYRAAVKTHEEKVAALRSKLETAEWTVARRLASEGTLVAVSKPTTSGDKPVASAPAATGNRPQPSTADATAASKSSPALPADAVAALVAPPAAADRRAERAGQEAPLAVETSDCGLGNRG